MKTEVITYIIKTSHASDDVITRNLFSKFICCYKNDDIIINVVNVCRFQGSPWITRESCEDFIYFYRFRWLSIIALFAAFNVFYSRFYYYYYIRVEIHIGLVNDPIK